MVGKLKESQDQRESFQPFWITFVTVLFFLAVMSGLTYILWNKPVFTIAYVPVDVIEWGFIGGIIAILYRISYKQEDANSTLNFPSWLIAKPIIGMVMGALVYFLAVSGQLFLNGKPEIAHTEFLNVLAFFGGFSDTLSLNLLNKLFSSKTTA